MNISRKGGQETTLSAFLLRINRDIFLVFASWLIRNGHLYLTAIEQRTIRRDGYLQQLIERKDKGNTIVANKEGEVSSCDIAYIDDLEQFNADYLKYTKEVHETCRDHDLSDDYMVIGTSAIVNVELDGAVGMNSGIFNNPFMIWGKYRIENSKALLTISFQFHHTQMDGAHAGRFLKNLQEEIERMR